jgi:ADP-ribose pyrophosphatase
MEHGAVPQWERRKHAMTRKYYRVDGGGGARANRAQGWRMPQPAASCSHLYYRPMTDEHLREIPVERRVLHRGRYLTFCIDTVRDPDGRIHTRDVVDHPGAVAVVALDGADVLLVRQFRHAAGRALLEIPAGTRDRLDDGTLEAPDLTARRELAEETGFHAGSWRHLGAFWTAPGFASEEMHLFLARDLTPVLGHAPDPDERLELVRMPWREAIARADRGEIEDAKSLVGLYRLARLADGGEL